MPLSSYLLKIKLGLVPNGTKCLKHLRKGGAAKLEEKQNKRRIVAVLASPPRAFVKNTPSKKDKSPTKSEKNPQLEKLHHLICKFVNNGGCPDRLINDPNFLNIVHHCLDSAILVKWGFSLLGNCKFVTI